MSNVSKIASVAFRAGVQGKFPPKTDGPTRDVHVNTPAQGPIERRFEMEEDFPQLEDKESAFLFGRSLRISGYILDKLKFPEKSGNEFLENIAVNIPLFKVHNKTPWGPEQTARMLDEYVSRATEGKISTSYAEMVIDYSNSVEANHQSNPDNKPYI